MRVVVVGSGMSRLACSRRLVEGGHDVVLVSADPAPLTTSYLAAAVWFPTAVGPPEAVARWGAATYDVLAAEAAAGVPGVVMRESLMLHRCAEPPPTRQPWADAVGGVRPAWPDELPPGYAHGLRFVVPLVEMPRYPAPPRHRRGVGGPAGRPTRRCARRGPGPRAGRGRERGGHGGRWARRGRDGVPGPRPDRPGVTNPGLSVSVRDEEHPGGRAYVQPRSTDCILVGTLEVGSWDTEPDLEQTAAILDRCLDIAPRLASSRVLESVVGLRPGRPAVDVAALVDDLANEG